MHNRTTSSINSYATIINGPLGPWPSVAAEWLQVAITLVIALLLARCVTSTMVDAAQPQGACNATNITSTDAINSNSAIHRINVVFLNKTCFTINLRKNEKLCQHMRMLEQALRQAHRAITWPGPYVTCLRPP